VLIDVHRGDKLSFVIDDDGTVKLEVLVYPTVASLHERGPGPDQNLSYNDMKEIAYQERLAGKYTPREMSDYVRHAPGQ